MNKIISIVTDWSPALGSGHVQRMMNLARFIKKKKDYNPYIISNKKFIDGFREFDDMMLNEIHPETSLIVRDMRDSSKEQIDELKLIAPVLAIDDLGKGSDFANFKIDILPNPESKEYNSDKFLYGYNFSESVKSLHENEAYKKAIDVAFYTGYKPEEKYVSSILEIFPKNVTAAVLSGNQSFLFENGKRKNFNMRFSEALLRSKILISHFGLTIYEGFACGAVPVTINPTQYHETLTEIVKKDLGIINIGLLGEIDKYKASGIIRNTLNNTRDVMVSPYVVVNRIESAMNEFYAYLNKLPVFQK